MSDRLNLPKGYVFSQPGVNVDELIKPGYGTVNINLNFPDKTSITILDAEQLIEIIKSHLGDRKLEIINYHNCSKSVEDIFFDNLDGINSQKVLWLSGTFSPENLRKSMLYVHIDRIIYNLMEFNKRCRNAIISVGSESKLKCVSFRKCGLNDEIHDFINALEKNNTIIYVGLCAMDECGVRKIYGGEELTQEAITIQEICERNIQYEKNKKAMIGCIMIETHDGTEDTSSCLKETASRITDYFKREK